MNFIKDFMLLHIINLKLSYVQDNVYIFWSVSLWKTLLFVVKIR